MQGTMAQVEKIELLHLITFSFHAPVMFGVLLCTGLPNGDLIPCVMVGWLIFVLAAPSSASVTWASDTTWCWRHLPCPCRRHCSIRTMRPLLIGTFPLCSYAFADNLFKENVNLWLSHGLTTDTHLE